jgi:hypothetical protein
MGLLASLLHPMQARTAHEHGERARVVEMIDRAIAMDPACGWHDVTKNVSEKPFLSRSATSTN